MSIQVVLHDILTCMYMYMYMYCTVHNVLQDFAYMYCHVRTCTLRSLHTVHVLHLQIYKNHSQTRKDPRLCKYPCWELQYMYMYSTCIIISLLPIHVHVHVHEVCRPAIIHITALYSKCTHAHTTSLVTGFAAPACPSCRGASWDSPLTREASS